MPYRNLPPHPSRFKRLLLIASCLALPFCANGGETSSIYTLAAPAETESAPSPVDAPALPGKTLAAPVEAAILPSEPMAVHELPLVPRLPGAIDLTAPTDDLWRRLRNGFAMRNLDNDLVLHYQQLYQSRPESLRRMVVRSRLYMHHIVEELDKRGMPTELALLPMVESAFNPRALSRAQAAGLWQFIPSTGRTYKLEQNWWQDQRRDVVASTSAALDYLQTIYDMLGDWHLTLASYNWGENAVKRAVQKNEAQGLPTDYSSLQMPAETRSYFPKLQALKNIFGNPQLMAELEIPSLDNRPYFATVESDRPIDVKKAARLAGMTQDEFIALNPSHNRPVIQANTPLVIPADKLETFQANLESHNEPLASWRAYIAKPGERLDKVASRFGMSLAELKRINGLHGRIKLASGSPLLVPEKGNATLDDISLPVPQVETTRSTKHAAGKGRHRFAKAAPHAAKAKLARADKHPHGKLVAASPKPVGKSLAKSSGEKKKSVAARPAKQNSKLVTANNSGRA